MHGGDKAQNKRSLKRDRMAGEGRVAEQDPEDMSHLEPIGITKSFQEGSKKEGGGNQHDKRRDRKEVETSKSCLTARIIISYTSPLWIFPLPLP